MIYYLLIINLFGFIVMTMDKIKARKQKRRTPEKHLFFIGLIGGAAGVFISMITVRHKTKHISFMILIPLFILIHIAIVYFIYR